MPPKKTDPNFCRGSTSYGFLNGATGSSHNYSGMQPDTTSYDYDSPITEYGSYATKYEPIRQTIAARNPVQTKTVDPPEVISPVQYDALKPDGQLPLSTVIDKFENKIRSNKVVAMEFLNINNDSGQSYGYIGYRKTGLTIPAKALLKISGYVKDTVLVLVNGELLSKIPASKSDLNDFGFWYIPDSSLTLSNSNTVTDATLDLVVENFGRNTGGSLYFKGLTDHVYINGQEITDWDISPLEFRKSWNNALNGWQSVSTTLGPHLYKYTLNISQEPKDSFLDMREWTKGITIVNGFVLGRHFFIGPQQALYLPAPFLNKGANTIIIFEHYKAPSAASLTFSSAQIWETRN